MQDLDFEELDKAVNSLMPSPSDNNSNKPAISVNSDTPIASNQNPTRSQPVLKTAPDMKSIDRPSTGRFMDVVHPSSDMRASLNVPQRSLSPSLAPQPTAPIANTPLIEEKPVDKPVVPVSNKENWAGLPNYQSSASNTPSESPFLPDTKVEKRPLGAFSDDNKSDKPVDEAIVAEGKDANKDWAEAPKIEAPANTASEAESDIPAELDSSILNIEANSSTHKNDVDMNNNPLSYTSSATSINQQYKEKSGSDKPVNGSIYDTSSYNTTTSKSVKKKSSWMMVVWILILLVVGVGAGLAFYTYMPDFKMPF
jgi:hypothetical protein